MIECLSHPECRITSDTSHNGKVVAWIDSRVQEPHRLRISLGVLQQEAVIMAFPSGLLDLVPYLPWWYK
jgi:hypothetical protein